MKHERQAAIEAILSAGHIPAGMELFAAGDKSQWVVIQDWIHKSDVYMLILGGRYGSIEPESGKSYTHLEYELALKLGKPLFAVVITEEKLKQKVEEENDSDVIERENHGAFQEFKALALSKTVRFWDDVKDIKIAIHETLTQFSERENLIGWIPGNKGVNGEELAEQMAEMARLSKENDKLRNRVSELEASNAIKVNGVPIEEYVHLLENHKFDKPDLGGMGQKGKQLIQNLAGSEPITLMHFFQVIAGKIDGLTPQSISIALKKLSAYGIITLKPNKPGSTPNIPDFTELGRTIFMILNKREMIVKLAGELGSPKGAYFV